jgi:hypothetical protein
MAVASTLSCQDLRLRSHSGRRITTVAIKVHLKSFAIRYSLLGQG